MAVDIVARAMAANANGGGGGAVTKKYVDDGLAKKQDKLTAGKNITIEKNIISSADMVYLGAEEPTDPDVKVWVDSDGTPDIIDYINGVDNKPKINGFELTGDKSSTDLGIIDKNVTGLTNYYDKTYIDGVLGNIETLLGGI